MEIHWPLILFTFFLAVASGIMFGQGLLTATGKGKKTQKVALISSFVALVVGGIAVFLHLQHWERIFNGFGHITSGITMEFIGVIVFVIVLLIYLLVMRRAEDETAPKWAGWMFMIIGVLMMLVVGDSYLMPSLPAWDSPMLLVYYVCNMLALGAVLTLIISVGCHAEEGMPTIKKLLIVGTVLELLAVLIYAIVITANGGLYTDHGFYFDPTLPDVAMVDTAAVVNLFTGESAVLFWILVMVIGCIVPVVLAFIINKAKGNVMTLAVVTLVTIVVGSLAWRVILYIVAIHIFAVF